MSAEPATKPAMAAASRQLKDVNFDMIEEELSRVSGQKGKSMVEHL